MSAILRENLESPKFEVSLNIKENGDNFKCATSAWQIRPPSRAPLITFGFSWGRARVARFSGKNAAVLENLSFFGKIVA